MTFFLFVVIAGSDPQSPDKRKTVNNEWQSDEKL
jgi:hypothetical protein